MLVEFSVLYFAIPTVSSLVFAHPLLPKGQKRCELVFSWLQLKSQSNRTFRSQLKFQSNVSSHQKTPQHTYQALSLLQSLQGSFDEMIRISQTLILTIAGSIVNIVDHLSPTTIPTTPSPKWNSKLSFSPPRHARYYLPMASLAHPFLLNDCKKTPK